MVSHPIEASSFLKGTLMLLCLSANFVPRTRKYGEPLDMAPEDVWLGDFVLVYGSVS